MKYKPISEKVKKAAKSKLCQILCKIRKQIEGDKVKIAERM